MIYRQEILMGRDEEYPLNSELEENLKILLERLNVFRKIYSKVMIVTSGYRPGKYNSTAGGAKKSAHKECQACDFRDKDGKLAEFILEHPGILEVCDLYMENPAKTPGWVHLQTRKTGSGNRIFWP